VDFELLLGIMSRRRTLRRQSGWSRERLEQHRRVALADLRAHAYAGSRFYRELHVGRVDAPLAEVPPVTKRMLMARFDEAVTDPTLRLADIERYLQVSDGSEPLLGRYRVNTTSGSTGHRGVFPFDRDEWTWIIGSYSRSYEWGGIVPKMLRRSRMAVVSTTAAWHQSAQVGSSVASCFVPTLRLDATAPLDAIVRRLNQWQPETLVGYASMLHLLAEEQLESRLRIRPRAVFSASEVLTETMRRRMTGAWGVVPFNVFGATETSTIASECSHHRMHLFEDLVITENVDDDYRPVPVGELGSRILVTVLFSRTLPLIRYEMSDCIAVSKEPCPCGRTLGIVSRIEGRAEEELQLLAADGTRVRIHPNLFHDVLDNESLEGWQVVETSDGLVVRLVDPHHRADLNRIGTSIERALASWGVSGSRVRMTRVDHLPRGRFGKAPLVSRETSERTREA
jgi:phenylacetate-CoA ligase